MGVKGRRWRLPAEPVEQETRNRLLTALALTEASITDVPDSGERSAVSSDLYPAERTWLNELGRAAGLSRGGAPSRIVRVLLRAALLNRDLLPVRADLDTSELNWLNEGEVPRPQRLANWLDALPRELLDEVLLAVESAIVRRDE